MSNIFTKNYLHPENILFLQTKSKNITISTLIDSLFQTKKIKDKTKFLHAILEREKKSSTAFGIGIAMPHAKLDIIDKFFIAIGLQEKSIRWSKNDRIPIKIIFMIGGPSNQQNEYLNILSSLTKFIKEEAFRKKLFQISSQESLNQLFNKTILNS